ncbi:hypothetical protein Moror_11557 [Moniliophthora roreri MCA 2997]|uniref:Uncharacterized protein n=1 Tax=Moniliophthora roreri (strain MCA 2997) TaxID=1381753 RepID=V2WNG5_MONRO|nr:hypothetical protein Moror_11557 [Moniliophthora roreri MCA 2997]
MGTDIFSEAIKTVIHVIGSGLNQYSATISRLDHKVEHLQETVRQMQTAKKVYVKENIRLWQQLFKLETDVEAIMDGISHIESELEDLKENISYQIADAMETNCD